MWDRLFEPSWSTYVYCVTACRDGGFLLGGVKYVDEGRRGWDAYVLKVDRHGETVWEKTYGSSNEERAYGMVETEDGGCVVVGYKSMATLNCPVTHSLEVRCGNRVANGNGYLWTPRAGLPGIIDIEIPEA